MNTYTPNPIDTSQIELSADLLALTELLAKNTHDVWAQKRLADGWKYGPERHDERKEHPCLVPYEELPENEKEYDRNTAAEVVKVMVELGFRIEK
ncbi:MAG: RyR domain-containing protein [Bacteroidales bacterium]|nr:RyR domain-containing protein [Bacteroidales bacterium]